MNDQRVLIVEDEFMTINAISDSLDALGYQVAGSAMSAIEALDILDNEKVDIAILDINIKGERDGI